MGMGGYAIRARYVVLQQRESGLVRVIAGNRWTTDAQQLEGYVRDMLGMTPTEPLRERGVAIVPRSTAWRTCPQAMAQWFAGMR